MISPLPHFSFILHTYLSNAILVKWKKWQQVPTTELFPSEVKRETGANPVRSRHCKREMKDTIVTGPYIREDVLSWWSASQETCLLPVQETAAPGYEDLAVPFWHSRTYRSACGPVSHSWVLFAVSFSPSLHGSFRRKIRNPQNVIHGPPLLSCSPNPAFPVQILICSIISLIVAKVCALHRVLQEPHASAR